MIFFLFNYIKNNKALVFIFSFGNSFFASSSQIVIQPYLSKESGGQVLKQEEIDKVREPAEGFWVFNATTGCINYYLKGRWQELCGTCLPRPGRIEQVTVKISGNDYILIPKFSGRCEKIVWQLFSETHEHNFRPGDSLRIPSSMPVFGDSLNLLLYPVTECGRGEGYTLILKNNFPLRFGPVMRDSLSGLRYRKVGPLDWLADDYVPPASINRPVPERPDIVVLKPSDNPCPAGWRLPSPTEWEALLNPYGENLKPLLEPPRDDNSGLGLSLSNMYAVKEKKIMDQGISGLYFTSKRDKNFTYYSNPRIRGFMILPLQNDDAAGGIRCVR